MKLPWFKKDPRKKKTKKVKKDGQTDLSADNAAETMRKRNKKMKDMLEEAGE